MATFLFGFVCVAVALYLFYALALVPMTVRTEVTLLGIPVVVNSSVTGESATIANPSPVAALAGTLSTRTDDTSGEITVATGHGVSTGDKVDIYWSSGQCYRATVGTVTSTTLPISAVEGGDAFPAEDSTVYVGKVNSATFNVVGNNMQGLVIQTVTSSGYVVLRDGSSTHHVAYVTPTTPYVWYTGLSTNPIAGDTLTLAHFSQRGTSGTATDFTAKALVS